MSLFVRTTGKGADIVLLHGWGMNADVWEDVIADLSKSYRVTAIDLPGHGRSNGDLSDYSLKHLAQQLMDIVPGDSMLLGWSLGGLLAMQMVLDYPGHFKKLVLVASSPQFIRDESWPDGIEAEVLDGFAGDMQEDYKNTVRRFIAIQAMGSDNAREEQRILRDRVFRHGNPQLAALEGGLKILHDSNLRPQLSAIQCPTMLIAGEHDSLFSRSAAEQTHQLIKNSKLCVIKGAGHAPFISHKETFLSDLKAFLAHE